MALASSISGSGLFKEGIRDKGGDDGADTHEMPPIGPRSAAGEFCGAGATTSP